MSEHKSIATLAGGCFWCLEAAFEQLRGVQTVESGYMGGQSLSPTYREVCTGTTGHAEIVQVTFDPQELSYRDLLLMFFTIHDPTTLNRQGADVGTQYRSAIFFHTTEQEETANQVIAELTEQGVWADPIVSEVSPATKFHKAEDYHQGYYRANPAQPYCQAVVAPKVAKIRSQFADRLKT